MAARHASIPRLPVVNPATTWLVAGALSIFLVVGGIVTFPPPGNPPALATEPTLPPTPSVPVPSATPTTLPGALPPVPSQPPGVGTTSTTGAGEVSSTTLPSGVPRSGSVGALPTSPAFPSQPTVPGVPPTTVVEPPPPPPPLESTTTTVPRVVTTTTRPPTPTTKVQNAGSHQSCYLIQDHGKTVKVPCWVKGAKPLE